jgi:transposase, IS5 family
VDIDGGELAALDLVQYGLSGDAERVGGRGERQPPVGCVLANGARSSGVSRICHGAPGKPITDRLVSISDSDARPIRKGKLGKPNEFGYVSQICEVTEHTRRGARGVIVPASTRLGNPAEDTLLPDTIGELTRLGIRPREIALDGGFNPGPTRQALKEHGLEPERVFIAGRQQPGSRRTQRRLQRYRTGAEGRISHLKRGYGMNRSRLKGDEGRQIWTGWSILAYNADTLAVRAR